MRIYEVSTDLATETLAVGQMVATKGLAVAGDGKGALYLILAAAPAGSTSIALADGNFAVHQRNVEIEGYSDLGAVSGAVGLDCAGGSVTTFELSTSGDITGVSISSVPLHTDIVFGVIIIIEIGATPDAITFGAAFNWSGGSAPAFDTASTKEVVVAFTTDGGTSWYAGVVFDGLAV